MEETLYKEWIGKIEKEYCSNQNCTCTQPLLIYMKTDFLRQGIHSALYSLFLLDHPLNPY